MTYSNDLGLLLLRVIGGGAMMTHGLQKFQNFSTIAQQFPDILGIGASANLGLVVFAELFCAAFVVFGLFTRLVTIPLMITMLVAIFVAHGADPFAKKELPLLFFSIFGALFLLGAGRFSVQAFFKISAGRFSWFMN